MENKKENKKEGRNGADSTDVMSNAEKKKKGYSKKVTPARRAIIMERRKKVAALYMRRFTQAQVAEQLGVGLRVVEQDLAYMRKLWAKEAMQSMGTLIARELAEIQHIENEAGMGYIRTQDMKYLELRLKCKDRRARLLGLDAPEKINPETVKNIHETNIEVNLHKLSESELNLLEKLLDGKENTE